MSLARLILTRVAQAGVRKAEQGGTTIYRIWQKSRRPLFVLGVAYSSGVIFSSTCYDWTTALGSSMYPTLPERKNFQLISRFEANGHNLKVGDIIVFKSPNFRDMRLGKRVIGLPGDYVVRDPHSAPSVGGAPVPGITDWRSDEEEANGVELKDREEPQMIQVPEGHVWVTGDNMSWSRDSRFFGPVPMALVLGRMVMNAENPFELHWFDREQLTRIPKEEEEFVLDRYRRGGGVQAPVVSGMVDASAVEDAD